MGNCVGSRYQENKLEESELEESDYVFKVTSVYRPEQQGTLTVKQSELQFVNSYGTEKITWSWRHVRKFACDGRVFIMDIGKEHENGEGSYAFSCKNVSELFLRVNNYSFRDKRRAVTQPTDTTVSDRSGRENTSNSTASSKAAPTPPTDTAVSDHSGRENTSNGAASSKAAPNDTAVTLPTDTAASDCSDRENTSNSSASSKASPVNNISQCRGTKLKYASMDFSSDRIQYKQIDFDASAKHKEEPAWCPIEDQTSPQFHTRKAPRKRRSNLYSSGRQRRHASLRGMSPLLESSTSEYSTTSAPTSPNDVTVSTFRNKSKHYINVNPSPYVNVETLDGPLPPPLPPKGLKPSPPPDKNCASTTEVKPASIYKASEEESLEGLNLSMENLDVFSSTSDIDKSGSKPSGRELSTIVKPFQICTLCSDGSKAIMLCKDCATTVCTECAKQHLRMSVFANHTLSILPEARSSERRKSTGCLLNTKSRYAHLGFKELPAAKSENMEQGLENPFHLVVFRKPTTSAFHVEEGAMKAKYSSVDFDLTKQLDELRIQRKQEQLQTPEERRAGFGDRYKTVNLRRSN